VHAHGGHHQPDPELDTERLREYLLRLATTTVFGGFDVDERGYQIGIAWSRSSGRRDAR
jgi:hypothetical protein